MRVKPKSIMDNLLLGKSLLKAHLCRQCHYLGDINNFQNAALHNALSSFPGCPQHHKSTASKESKSSHLVTSHIQCLSALSFPILQGNAGRDRREVHQIKHVQEQHHYYHDHFRAPQDQFDIKHVGLPSLILKLAS